MSATVTGGLRIGEVAKRVGTTPRTIRYYEEIGILPSEGGRESGRHRLYGEREVQRLSDALRLKELLGVSLDELRELLEAEDTRAALRDALRLKELLGVSLDELRELLEAEDTRAALRDEWRHGDPGIERRREMLAESRRLIDRQLALVRRRRDEIAALEDELADKRRLVARRMRELDAE